MTLPTSDPDEANEKPGDPEDEPNNPPPFYGRPNVSVSKHTTRKPSMKPVSGKGKAPDIGKSKPR